MAEALGVKHSTVSRWESGQTLPELARAFDIERVLGVGGVRDALVEAMEQRSVEARENTADNERGADVAADTPTGKPRIPEGAALLSGRLKDLSADDIRYINDMIERLAKKH